MLKNQNVSLPTDFLQKIYNEVTIINYNQTTKKKTKKRHTRNIETTLGDARIFLKITKKNMRQITDFMFNFLNL